MDELLQSLIEYAKPDYVPEMDSFLQSLIEDAEEEVCNEMYPHGFEDDTEYDTIRDIALKRYKRIILRIAKYHYDKQGREGAMSWSENGTSVSYESSATPASYLRGIIPVARIV